MDKYALTAQKLRIAKLDYEIAQEEADEKKKVYEQLRRQLCNEMVASEVLKFEIAPQDNTSGLSFRLETKTRWSPVVENKDRLVEKLRNDAFDLEVYQTALAEGKITEKERLLWEYVLSAYGAEEFTTKQLEKDFRNAAYATIRTFVMKFHEMGLLTARKAGNRVFYRVGGTFDGRPL